MSRDFCVEKCNGPKHHPLCPMRKEAMTRHLDRYTLEKAAELCDREAEFRHHLGAPVDACKQMAATIRALAATLPQPEEGRSCTCAPEDISGPCQRRYALSECLAALRTAKPSSDARAVALRIVARVVNLGGQGMCILDAPCVFCGYNGARYWQRGTHAQDCPFSDIGGDASRADHIVSLTKLPQSEEKP